MITLPPFARLATAALWVAVAILVKSLLIGVFAYVVILAYVARADLLRLHLRFVTLGGVPLLAALLLTWAIIMPVAQPQEAATMWDGAQIALIFWARILIMAATCQWFLLPLVREPQLLRQFAAALRLPIGLTVLVATPVLFVPEIERQIRQVVDARRAQGLAASGVRGLLSLPTMMVPVLAALIETALNRAELWDHRGLLSDERQIAAGSWTRTDLAILATLPPSLLLIAEFVL